MEKEKEKKSIQMADADFIEAAIAAKKAAQYGADKWPFIVGYLQNKLANAYEAQL